MPMSACLTTRDASEGCLEHLLRLTMCWGRRQGRRWRWGLVWVAERSAR